MNKKVFCLMMLCLSILLISPDMGFATLTDGLVGYWSFDNCDATDYSEHGNTGTPHGNPQCVNGKKGKAFSFDGTDDYIDIGSNGFPEGSSARTMHAWFKMDRYPSSLNNTILGYGTNNYSQYSDIGVTNYDHKIFFSNWGDAIFSSVSASLNEWYHLVATFDGSDSRLYVNGVLNAEGSMPFNTAAGNAYIGWCGAEELFSGVLDEVRIYNRALSDAEVQELYTSATWGFTVIDMTLTPRNPLEYSGPILHWDLSKNLEGRVQDSRVLYRVNSRGSDDIRDFSLIESAIKEAANSWQSETSSFRLEYAGTTRKKADPNDRTNTVFWDEQGKYFKNTNAYAKIVSFNFNTETGELIDVDIALNGAKGGVLAWRDKKRPFLYFKMKWNVYDIQEVDWIHGQIRADVQANLTHEFGHLLGLWHSSVDGATMSVYGSGTYQRYLEQDDIAGMSYIYPKTPACTHTASGRVYNSGCCGVVAPISGVTVNLSGTITSSAASDSNGNYVFSTLCDGTYAVTYSDRSNTFAINGADVSDVNLSKYTGAYCECAP